MDLIWHMPCSVIISQLRFCLRTTQVCLCQQTESQLGNILRGAASRGTVARVTFQSDDGVNTYYVWIRSSTLDQSAFVKLYSCLWAE